ncbi:MAG TPA: hypothetical protein PK253_16215 [Spirochaetota bacterium]|nr:hypothetical protein [Spirochaetota bacterium]HPQ54798.1 hypothetical protein [Spirochaetota bacterium]
MKNKKFDCVEMKRKSQEYIYNQIKDMNHAEELEYWRKGTEKLIQRQNTLKEEALSGKK